MDFVTSSAKIKSIKYGNKGKNKKENREKIGKYSLKQKKKCRIGNKCKNDESQHKSSVPFNLDMHIRIDIK